MNRHENTTPNEDGVHEAPLRELIHRLATATELQDLTEKAAAWARDATGSSGAYIQRVTDRDDGAEVIATAGKGTPRRGSRATLPDRFPTSPIDDGRVVVPLRAGDELLGALGLVRSKDAEPFHDVDVDRAATVGDTIAIAMQRVATLEREREARGQLTRTLEGISDGFVSLDTELRVHFLNRVARETLNLDPNMGPTDLAGRPLSELVPRPAFERFEGEVWSAMNERTRRHFEQHIGPPDRWFDVSAEPSDGRISVFFRDITDRKRAEVALRRSERRQTILADTGQLLESTLSFQSTLDRIAHLLVRWLCDWCVIYTPVNGGVRRAVLAARDPDTEMLVRRSIGEVHPEWSEIATLRVFRTGRSILLTDIAQGTIDAASEHSPEFALLLREHRPRSAIDVPIVARGQTIAVIALVSTNANRVFTEDDLSLVEEIARRAALALDGAKLYEEATRRVLAESALRKAAAAVTAQLTVEPVLQEIARNALVALDAAGSFIERVDETENAVVVATAGERIPPNGASTPYAGSFARHVIESGKGERIADLGEPGRLVPKVLTTRCRGCPALVVPLLKEQARGALFFVRGPNSAEFEDDEVERASIFAELAGLAFRKAYLLEQAERRQADAEAASRARDDVLAIVSHDLRNPLHAISMAASLLVDEEMAIEGSERLEQYAIIKRSSERMNRLIDDLLDANRIESGHFAVQRECQDPIEIADEAFETFRPIAESRGLHLQREVHGRARPVSVDRDRIMQVLGNYLDNAFKFSPEGREVVLRVEPEADERGVRYSVQDHGPGIAADAVPHVFERYWQSEAAARRGGGAGLGLAIAKGIADAHEGRVWVESVVGKGSTFYLLIPYSEECR